MTTGEMALRAAEGHAGPEPLLLAQCQTGDPQAFARLVALHERMVFSLAARILGDAEEARDVAQEVFLQVYRTLGSFEGRSSLRTWIYRIVVNHCRNRQRFWRRRFRDRSHSLDDLTPTDEAQLRSGDDTPHAALERRERGALVQRALLRLSFDHRAILVLREVQGLGGEEVARTLGIAEGTVKSRLARARDAFRRALEEEGR